MKIYELLRLQKCIECVATRSILSIRIWYTFQDFNCLASGWIFKFLIQCILNLLPSKESHVQHGIFADVFNLIESYLMGKIQDQCVSTYVFNSLSVLTLATGIQQVVTFSNNGLNILQDVMVYVITLIFDTFLACHQQWWPKRHPSLLAGACTSRTNRMLT